MAGIFESLGFGGKTTPAPAPGPAAAGTPSPVPAGGTGDQTGTKVEDQQAGDKSPLDAFSDLFTIDKDAKQKPAVGSVFEVDPVKIKDASKQMDFTKNISDELLEKIRGGGEEATSALIAAMNQMSQTNYAYAVALATQMAKKASEHTLEQVQALVPDLVRNLRANEDFSNENPALNHPAAQPLIKAMMQQFATKYPDASPKELRVKATEYLSTFGKLFQTDDNAGLLDKTKPGVKTGPQETDWSKYLA